jgi:hypothetical protein
MPTDRRRLRVWIGKRKGLRRKKMLDFLAGGPEGRELNCPPATPPERMKAAHDALRV